MHCLSLASASDIAPPASIQLCDCASHVHQYVGGGVKESGAGVGGGVATAAVLGLHLSLRKCRVNRVG